MRALAAFVLLAACARKPPPAIKCDGELDEPAWLHSIRSGAFLADDGKPAAPYSDARFLVEPDALYVALYAADQNIHSGDEFTLRVGAQSFAFPVEMKGPDIGVDTDGTIDDDSDDDEEWIVEARIPYSLLPHGRTPVVARRCDDLKTGQRACGTARLRLDLP